MEYSERDLLVIYYSLLDNDFNKINEEYKELSKKFDSLKLLITVYHKERRERDDRSVTIQDLSYLLNIIHAVQYINKPLTNDDYDTIKVLMDVSYEYVRFNLSNRKFKSLLILFFHDQNCRDKKFIESLNLAYYCFTENYKNTNLEGLHLSNKIYELYNLSVLIDTKLVGDKQFRNYIICKLVIYGCLNNNFEYLHNYLENPLYYSEHLYHNGFFGHNMDHLIYQNIEKVFVKASYIKK